MFYLLIDYFFKKNEEEEKKRDKQCEKILKKLRSARVKMVLLEYLAAEEFSR